MSEGLQNLKMTIMKHKDKFLFTLFFTIFFLRFQINSKILIYILQGFLFDVTYIEIQF